MYEASASAPRGDSGGGDLPPSHRDSSALFRASSVSSLPSASADIDNCYSLTVNKDRFDAFEDSAHAGPLSSLSHGMDKPAVDLMEAESLSRKRVADSEACNIPLVAYKTCRTGIIRDIPCELDNDSIISKISSPYRILEVKRLNRRTRVDGELQFSPSSTVLIKVAGQTLPRSNLPPICINCGGNHTAISPDCPTVVRHRMVTALAAKENIPISEARQRVSYGAPPRNLPADASNRFTALDDGSPLSFPSSYARAAACHAHPGTSQRGSVRFPHGSSHSLRANGRSGSRILDPGSRRDSSDVTSSQEAHAIYPNARFSDRPILH